MLNCTPEKRLDRKMRTENESGQPAQLLFDLDKHLPSTLLGDRKFESIYNSMGQGKRKRSRSSQGLVLNDALDNQHLLDLNSMELPKGRRTLAANFFNTTVKPNIRSKLGMRSVVDTLTCIMIFLIIITVAPSLTGASPIAGFTMTEVSEQSDHHSTHSAHSRMRINTEEFENIVRIRSVYPVMSECLGRMSEESVHNVTKLSPPAMHLLGAMSLTFALPVIFMVLYGLISIFTFLVEIGVAAIKSSLLTSISQRMKIPEKGAC